MQGWLSTGCGTAGEAPDLTVCTVVHTLGDVSVEGVEWDSRKAAANLKNEAKP